MSTLLPKTYVRVVRKNQTHSLGAGYTNSEEIVFEGLARVADISSNSDFDKFFPSGSQDKKRAILYDDGQILAQDNDYLYLEYSKLGQITEFNEDNVIEYQIKVPQKQGTMSNLRPRRKELFAISLQ